ncbi:MAG: polyprenyl synthetase family protein [Deltaproteobacteria bacterium]|nr:polyprenyl synthetase family protein [Deltaproteobacteria bacterium]
MRAAQVDRELGRTLGRLRDFPAHGGVSPPTRLLAAMAHSLLAGGKRLRPVICIESCVAAGGHAPAAFRSACALEMVHTYSLIHDDLPAMDDDDLRRGQPTCHKAFDEATAILAGDGLLTDAFLVLAQAPRNPLRQVTELAAAAGSFGMVGGQMDDILAEGQDPAQVELEAIHRRKTGRLFVASSVLGGLCAGAGDREIAALRTYGAALGFAFQVWDDVLDVVDTTGKGGKGVGRDEKHDKATYVRRHGLDGARFLAHQAADRAVHALKPFGKRGAVLAALARYAVERDH